MATVINSGEIFRVFTKHLNGITDQLAIQERLPAVIAELAGMGCEAIPGVAYWDRERQCHVIEGWNFQYNETSPSGRRPD